VVSSDAETGRNEMARGIDGRTVRAALFAGLVGAVTVEAYLFAVGLASWPGTYQWIASALRGPEAFTGAGFAWLGLGMHVGVSLGWAVAWALASVTWPRLLGRPLVWGAAYGVVVFVAMQGVTALAGIWAAPAPRVLFHYVVDHAVFFGLPVAGVYGWVGEGNRP
jgi:hypothetical protein